MKSPEPTGTKIARPPEVFVPELPGALEQDLEKPGLDETHPRLANALHYLVIGGLILIIFVGSFFFFGARGGLVGIGIGLVVAVGKVLQALKWFSSDYKDS